MRRSTLEDHGQAVAERRRALPPNAMHLDRLRNNGARRTPEKRALLALLDRLAAEQGREPPFPSRY
jgi:hypothetical protein